MKNINIGIGS